MSACHDMADQDNGIVMPTALLCVQLLVSILRKRTWRHELQQLDAADKVAPRGCEHFAGLLPTAAAYHDCTVCHADCLLQLWRRVNVQLGGGNAPTVHMDADSSWHPKSSEDGGNVGSEAGGGAALRGWRARVVQALTLAAVAMCLWALVESILSTHGSAQKFWDIIDDAERQVSSSAPQQERWPAATYVLCCSERSWP